MVWRSIGITLALLSLLLLCGGNAFATITIVETTTMGDGNPTGGAWLYDWGTIKAYDGYTADGTGDESTGSRLSIAWTTDPTYGNVKKWSQDYKQETYPIPSPDGSLGEYWDVEFLAFQQDATNYYFLGIMSTNQTLYDYSSTIKIAVGDLAINPTGSPSDTTPVYKAGYGVKLAGSQQGKALQNATFGWGIVGNDTLSWEKRNPLYTSGTYNPGGFYPGQTDPGYANPYDWASNFDPLSSTTTEAVKVHQVLGIGTSNNRDGPAGTNDLNTYAYEVQIPKTHLAFLGTIHDFSIASTCLNDGMKSGPIGASPPVPELPPTLLAVMLPAIGLLVRRMKSR